MTKVIARFSGEFRRIKNVGDSVSSNETIGEIFHGDIWQPQNSSVAGQIDSMTETGVQVRKGDSISEISAFAFAGAGLLTTTLVSEEVRAIAAKKAAPKKASKKSRSVSKKASKKGAPKKKSATAKSKTANKKNTTKKAKPKKIARKKAAKRKKR